MTLINYRPYEDRIVDQQYSTLLRTIRDRGVTVTTQQEEGARMVIGYQMRFDLANGFPLITERDLLGGGDRSTWNQCLGELFAFLHGAHTQAELESFGCFWWKRWVTPEKCSKRGLPPGDLGPGSYGPAWAAFPTPEGTPFNQVTHLIEQIREMPHLRTHFLTPWIPQYIGRGKGKVQKVVVAPCHGWVHVFVDPRTRVLSVHHFQRSADSLVGLVSDMIMYGALTMMLAQVTGNTAGQLVYTLSDAHVFESQFGWLERVLNTEPRALPTVTLDPTVTDILDFRQHHFTVKDYHPQLPRTVIPTPV